VKRALSARDEPKNPILPLGELCPYVRKTSWVV